MKDNKTFTMVLVVIIGVLIGLAILSKQSQSPFFKVIYDQQMALLKGQKEIVDLIKDVGDEDEGLESLINRLDAMEERIAKLETRIKVVQDGVEVKPTKRPSPPQEDFSKVYEIPVAHSPVVGNKAAPVTLVEFIDIQCPYSTRFHFPLVEAAKAYPGKVNYVVKHFPLQFHPQAKNAAKASLAAAEQGKYAEMVDILLKNGRELSKEKYLELAAEIGLNVDKFKQDLIQKDAQYEDFIQKDMVLGSNVGVQGTPTMYINGRKTTARTVEAFKAEIDALLKK